MSKSIVKKDRAAQAMEQMQQQEQQVKSTGKIQYGYAAPSIRQSAVSNGSWPVKPAEDSEGEKRASVQSAVDKTFGTMLLPIATVNVDASGNKSNAQSDYEDARRRLWAYQNDPQAQAAAKEKEKAYNQALQEGATGTGAVYQDETLSRLQQEAKNAEQVYESEKTAAHDQNIYNQDMADISAMSDAERKTLASYGNYLRIQRQDASSEMGPEPGEGYPLPREYQALVDKYGESRLAGLAETATREAQLQQRQAVQDAAKRTSDGTVGGIASSIVSIPANLAGGAMALAGRLDEAKNATGRYQSLSPYTYGDALNTYTDTVRQNVAGQIAGDGSNFLRTGASILYQVGMGVADSTAKAIVLGPAVGAATSAMGSYTRTLADATERGATAAQAKLLASSTAALDFAMDKIPLDRLFSLASSGSTSALKAALHQAGIEMTTEGASFLGSQLLEMSILQQNSQYAQSIQAYRAQGLSPDDAVLAANKDLLSQAGQQLLVAGLSGGISAGVSTAVGNHRAKNAPQQDPTRTMPQEPATPPQSAAPDSPIETPTPPQTPPQEAPRPDTNTQRPAQQQPPDPLETVSRMAQENAQKTQQQKQQSRQAVQDQVEHMTGGKTESQETSQPQGQRPPSDSGTVGKQSEPSGDTQKSATFTNSGLHSSDEDIRSGYQETVKQEPAAGDYQQKHNSDVYSVAQERTATPEKVNAEYDYIMNKSGPLTAEDGVTGRLVAKQLFKDGDTKRLVEMNKRLAREATNAGQFNQAFSITGKMRDASDPLSAADSATARISAMSQKDSKYPGTKSGLTYEAWQDKVSGKISGLAMEVDRVKDGDTAAMKNVITKIAKERNTTAFFGTSDRLTKSASSVLDKLDFEDLKKIANTQIASMPDDYRKRGKMEIVNGIRKQSMLSSLKTFERNLAGNGAVGLLDSASDSFGGRLADMVLSKITGKRTIGNDLSRAGTYMKSAADAGRFAALCVELNVPIETDVNASFDAAVSANKGGKYIGKTFSATGNPVMRVLYAYQKYMSYALEVSDKIFEGGTSGATEASLRRLKNSGLSDDEVSRLSDYTANRRTFKDATWQDEQGRTRGSDLSRTTQSFKNIAKGKGGIVEPVVNAVMDTAIPFASVPMNVTQTGTDYTVGVLKGIAEMAKIAHDAKHGVNIPVERQRQAASDFGRGLTGAALISLAAAAAAKGIIQVHDDSDKDKKALDQSQGLSGAQINWTAMSRAADGGDETWQSGDLVTSLDFLEPFNTHMYLGVELANAESGMDYVKAPLASIFSSFMDSPMNDGLNQITELISDAVTAAESKSMADIGNAVAEYGGNVASSFIPQFVRQAAQAKDGFYRDTRGENSAEYALNSIKSAVPGLSETLPKKMDGFGNEQKRLGALSTFLDPTNTKRINLYGSAEYLDELSSRTGDESVYPDRQAPMTTKNAIGEDVTLTSAQRETYQRTYGDKVSDYYGRLRLSKDFSALSDELKTDALNQVKDYAAQFARASVTDFKGTPEGSATEIVDGVVSQVTKSKMSSTMDDISDAWEHGYSTQKNSALLDSLYRDMQKLSAGAKDRVLDSSTGQPKTYLEARTQGLSSNTALSILRQVQSVPKEDRNKAAYQYQAVASTKGLTDAQMDKAMKLYMPDYDPKEKEPVKTEPRYDYIRQQLGFSPKEYAAAAYAMRSEEADTDGNGRIKKNEAIQAIMDLGYDQQTATWFWGIYSGNGGNAYKNALNRFISENY